MGFVRNLKIRVKLLVGFGIMVLFMGVIGYAGFTSMRGVQRQLETIFSVQMPSIDF